MVLSQEEYYKQLGLPSGMPSQEVSKHLRDMMLESIGSSMVNQVVEVLGTVETQGLQLQVSTKVLEGQTS